MGSHSLFCTESSRMEMQHNSKTLKCIYIARAPSFFIFISSLLSEQGSSPALQPCPVIPKGSSRRRTWLSINACESSSGWRQTWARLQDPAPVETPRGRSCTWSKLCLISLFEVHIAMHCATATPLKVATKQNSFLIHFSLIPLCRYHSLHYQIKHSHRPILL